MDARHRLLAWEDVGSLLGTEESRSGRGDGGGQDASSWCPALTSSCFSTAGGLGKTYVQTSVAMSCNDRPISFSFS